MKKIDKIIHNAFVMFGIFGVVTLVAFILGSFIMGAIHVGKNDIYALGENITYFALMGLLLYPFVRSYKGGWKF